eukprot:9621233-Prorocentrum_lima.AAC.1
MDWFCGLDADPFLTDVSALRRLGSIHRRMQTAVHAGSFPASVCGEGMTPTTRWIWVLIAAR